jgi:hypothetical protein
VQTLISQYNADVAKAAKKERERQQKVRLDLVYNSSLTSYFIYEKNLATLNQVL